MPLCWKGNWAIVSPGQIPQKRVDCWSGWLQEGSSPLHSSAPMIDRPKEKVKLSVWKTYGLMWKSALFPSGVWFGTTLKLQWTNTKCFICTKEKSETCYKTLCFLNLICFVFLRWITATAVRTEKDFLRHRYHCVWDHRITHVQTNMVCCLQSSVVCDVFSKRLFSIDMFSVNKIAAVLIHHTLCSLPKCLHRRVLPPRPQVTIFIILTTWWQEEGRVQ